MVGSVLKGNPLVGIALEKVLDQFCGNECFAKASREVDDGIRNFA